MRLQSVRDLKLEVAVEVFAPIAERLLDRAMSLKRRLGIPPLQRFGLGIGKGKRPGDFTLAVRLQSQSPLLQALLDRVREKAGGEINVATIGRISAHAKKVGKKAAKPAAAPSAAGPKPADLQSVRRPLVIGCSVGHVAAPAGTLGLIARHRKTGRTVLLSNSHVFAQAGLAQPGDVVTQPGRTDGGGVDDHVGVLLDFVPMKSDGANFVDAASVIVDDSIQLDNSGIPGIGPVTVQADEPIAPGDKVKKLGRTSGLTQGEIMATELDHIEVDYIDVGTIVFDDQIEIRGLPNAPFSTGGDSGSLVVNARSRAVGLVFAGNPQLEDGAGLSFANPLSRVMTALDLVTL
jgi:hypothetical protein